VKLPGKAYEVHLLAIIVLYVLGFAVYLNSFPVPFVFDDYPNIRDNESIRLESIDVEGLRAAAVESHVPRRPIANLSFAINHLVGGYDVKGYHLVNIFIHVANGALVYFLALMLLRRNQALGSSQPASSRRLQLAALLAAAIFIAHPAQVQAVTYIVQRMTSMATMFYLLSMLLYLLGRERRGVAGRGACWAGALVSWMLALGSKEIAATLPVMIVVTEYLFYRDADKPWLGISPWYPLLAVTATIGVSLFYLGVDPAATITAEYTYREFTVGERLLTELRVLVYYLSLMMFPFPGRLSLEHTFTISRSIVDPVTTLAAAALLAAMFLAALRLARHRPIVSFCILWFLVTLSVESSFVGLELVFEHRLYLPMFAFALAVAYLFFLTRARHGALAVTLGVALIAALATASVMRNWVWQDPLRLWSDAVSKNPASYRARNNLGRVLVDRGNPEQAAREFGEAIRIKPDYAEAHNNLGTLLARSDRFEQAMLHFGTAIELNPRYAQAYNNLGVALLSQGRVRDAASQLGRAVGIAPGYAKAHRNLSRALAQMGRPRESCRHLLLALHLDPALPHSPAALANCRAISNVE
jgi:tetratricopeptide (TPR) repeat protein